MTTSARLSVRVTPRGSRNTIEGWTEGGSLRVRVTAAPADGKANAAVIAVLAKALSTAPSRITLVSGASGRTKILAIDGLSLQAIREAIG